MAKTRKKKHQRNSKNKKDKRDHDQTDNKEMKRAGQMDSLVRSRFPDEPTHELFHRLAGILRLPPGHSTIVPGQISQLFVDNLYRAG